MTPKKAAAAIFLPGFFCLLVCVLWTGAAQAGANAGQERQRVLFPRVGLGLEAGAYITNRSNSTGLIHMDVEVDMLQYGRHLIYLQFREDTFLGVPDKYREFNNVYFRLATPGYRYDLGDHYLGFLVDHWCINNYESIAFRGPNTNRTFASVFLISLDFLDKGMLLGLKDRGIVYDPAKPFEWLGRWHYRATAGRVIAKDPDSLGLNWEMKGQVRLDLFRYRIFVPYLSGGSEVWVGPSWRFFPWGEAGVRVKVRENLNLIPFFSGGRQPEIYRLPRDDAPVQRRAKEYLYGGVRMEASLGTPGVGPVRGETWQFLPEVHGTLGYNWFPSSHYYGWGGNMEIDLEVLRRAPWTIFCYSGIRINTRKSDLSIKKGKYWLQYGLTYSREPFFAEAFLEHAKHLAGRNFNNLPESAHQAGVRLGTQGMKPGYYNYGISFDQRGFHWLNRFSTQISAAHYFQNQNWQYLWNIGGQGRWDICRYGPLVGYVSGGAAWLDGGGATPDGVDGTAETGIRVHGKFDVNLYFRYQHVTMGRKIWGPADNRTLVGVQALF